MTLVNRVSAFFLAALGLVLAVISAMFYGTIRQQMTVQFHEQLNSTLHALVAAIEVEPEEVKWQPTEHTIGLGIGAGPAEIRWVVIGDGGHIVERSRNASDKFLRESKSIAETATSQITETEPLSLKGWRFLRQRLSAPAPDATGREFDEYDQIVVVVARSTAELSSNLQRLAALTFLLPLGGWLVAAAVGRSFCRHALHPVLAMAREARDMSAADFERRLPVSASGDELSDLGISFNTLLDRLQISYEAQRRFTSNAAHELRTPLTVLLGQIEVALRKPRTSDEYRRTLELLHQEAKDLQQTLESLLYLARSVEDDSPPDAIPTQLAEWLSQYVGRWSSHPRYRDLHLQASDTADVVVSQPLLSRLLDNLVGNALKYSPHGTPVVLKLSRNERSPTYRSSMKDREYRRTK
jgi:signal transduction histidine kinase